MSGGRMADLTSAQAQKRHGAHIHIDGIVQGVGFRPFVYGLATRLSLVGWVKNTSAGVDIEVDGADGDLEHFVKALQAEAPPLAQIHHLHWEMAPTFGFDDFRIVPSQSVETEFQPISPDVSVCPDCLAEMMDPADRRYRYPFINCTNCGPRFTIIEDIPYDRPKTTMRSFEMCPDCRREYEDPLDRRFHAQPVACPTCGPHVWLERSGATTAERDDAIQDARRLLQEGRIVAVKGLGGFHLACDATNPTAVEELRRRKGRIDKPFALMMPDPETVDRHCELRPGELELLTSRERPIVIVDRRSGSPLAAAIAPSQDTVGVMLPYTPLHVLLLEPEPGYPDALVMTSGNYSEEPIATGNQEARERLDKLADAFLMHDRDIRTRCDDSVVRAHQTLAYPLRRSRGYAPSPLQIPSAMPSILATGAELKNTFCMTRDAYAFMSHHIGDLENYETLTAFENGVRHFERLFRIKPEALAYDLHPDYLATRYALERSQAEGLPAVGVQHHHAHIAAVMADAGLGPGQSVIGVAFDGTGYGDDGAIWGGEFMVAGYPGYRRAAHLRYFPMPGGDAAIKQPWRLALALLRASGLPWTEFHAPVNWASSEGVRVLEQQIEGNLNAPLTSSAGRLFDGIASLTGVRHEVNYEAQAAIEFEALADPNEPGSYDFDLHADGVLDPSPMLTQVLDDLHAGLAVAQISTRFHRGLAEAVVATCERIRQDAGPLPVALSGGVWQNRLLLELTTDGLDRAGFTTLVHRQVPTNDGGLALGQAMIAGARLREDIHAAP